MIKTKLLFFTVAACMIPLSAQEQPMPMGGHDITKQFDAVITVDSGTKNLKNETITSDEDGKNAVFAQNTGVVNANGLTIHTKKNGSRGLYVAFGGTINAKKVDVTTEGEHCAAFATDMGEGTVTVDGGKALTKGKGSPVIYSTGAISVKNLKGSAENSEMAVIEGKNSVNIEKSILTGGSGLDEEVAAGIMLYQSMSGDAHVGTASFTAKNSILTNTAAGDRSAFFYVTNTNAVVNLETSKLEGNTNTLILASGNNSRRGWGREGENGGQLEFNLISQAVKGDVIVDEISSVKLNLGKKSSLIGAVNNKKGGKVDITLDKTAKLELTADAYFNRFEDADDTFKNIKANGHVIYYNRNLAENSALKGRTYILPDGGKLAPTEYDFSLLEKGLGSSDRGGMKMPMRPNLEKFMESDFKPSDNDMQGGNNKNQPPKMDFITLTGTLNVVSEKAMLIDDDNKAILLSVMENRKTGGNGQPPMGNGGMPPMGNGGMQPPSDFQGQNGEPPRMQGGQKDGKQPPKPVTLDDLKKLNGKKVEVQVVLSKDGTYTVFTLTQKK